MLSSDAPTQKASIHDAAISPAPACGPFKNVSEVFGQLLLLKNYKFQNFLPRLAATQRQVHKSANLLSLFVTLLHCRTSHAITGPQCRRRTQSAHDRRCSRRAAYPSPSATDL